MGFKILPYEDRDEDKYDVFTLTSKNKWNPHKTKKLYSCTKDAHVSDSSSDKDMDSSLDSSMPSLFIRGHAMSDTSSSGHSSDDESSIGTTISDMDTLELPIVSGINKVNENHRTVSKTTKRGRKCRKKRHHKMKGRKRNRLRRKRILHSVKGSESMKCYDPTDCDV